MTVRLSAILLCLAALSAARGDTVLIEAERFDDLGGWVSDCQFMDRMGSPFLLAHGLGTPVADALTEIDRPAAGTYRVWVRTRDWVATWNAPGAPGTFRLHIDGEPLDHVFGTEGAAWHWEDGGTVTIGAKGDAKLKLTLEDLTGFEGRCDAIVLSSDPDFTPPNEAPAMREFRHRQLGLPETPPTIGEFDVVVVGGGISGTCAALSAARSGLSVALVQDRPVLGGNNSSEVRVWLQGATNKEPLPRVGDIVAELEQTRRAHYGPANTADLYEDERKLAIARAEENLTLLLNHRGVAAEMADRDEDGEKHIAAVIAQHTITGERKRIVGRWFVDATGDGCLGAQAGADFEMTLPGHMGRCNLWHAKETDAPVAFPRCPWALDLSDKPFPGREPADIKHLGGWYWESGFDHDPMLRGEYIRDWNLRAMYGAWDALKNVDGKFPNHKLAWAAHISGKRESRRLLGDVILTRDDVLTGREFPDGCVPTGWSIDLHLADPKYDKGFEGDGFISKATFTHFKGPVWIPYRCLYSRNVDNLFMAGRDISVTHDALGTVRVMRTGGCMGEVVGMAASLCKRLDTTPRGVYEKHLNDLMELLKVGVGRPPLPREPAAATGPPIELSPPAWLDAVGANVAPKATVTVSGSREAAAQPIALLTDGKADLRANGQRWLGEPAGDSDSVIWVELDLKEPRTITAARIVSGYNYGGGRVGAPIGDFSLKQEVDGELVDIPGTKVTGNMAIDWGKKFEPITTRRVRLLVTSTETNVARIWEIELYENK